jgi:hypothetical protein
MSSSTASPYQITVYTNTSSLQTNISPTYTMKLTAIIATVIAVAAAAAVPAELQERQCILNGREYKCISANILMC